VAARVRLRNGPAAEWPTEEELSDIALELAVEEVLVREAIATGVHERDAQIRRRLVKAMRPSGFDVMPPDQPAEAEVQAWFEAHRDRYLLPARVKFTSVFVRASGDLPSDRSRAERLLERLRAAQPALGDAAAHGDRFQFASRFPLVGESDLALQFGAQFAAGVFALPTGAWSGPVASPHGQHLVFVEEREEVRRAELDEVRTQVTLDAFEAARHASNVAYWRELLSGHDVQIGPMPGPDTPRDGPEAWDEGHDH
jgi:hypothetical protein